MSTRPDYGKLLWVETLMVVVATLIVREAGSAVLSPPSLKINVPEPSEQTADPPPAQPPTHRWVGGLELTAPAPTRNLVVAVPMPVFEQLKKAQSIVILGEK